MKLVVLFLLAHRTADVACTVINRIHKDLLVTSNGSWLGLLDGFFFSYMRDISTIKDQTNLKQLIEIQIIFNYSFKCLPGK